MADKAQQIRTAVDQYTDPYLQQTLLEAGALDGLRVSDTEVGGTVELGIPVIGYEEQFRSSLAAHLATAGVSGCRVRVEQRAAIVAHSVQRPLKPLPGVSNIVAVASGKGGVGKSTVAANLALAWASGGARVGILDADIYGPSQPLMLGLEGQRPTAPDGKHLVPLEAHGIKAMSIGFLLEAGQAVVWRGPMVTQALTQLLGDTAWGELDYLVVDMPPGTGDIQLTLAQRVPVLGIVENMSLHVCTHCGHVEHIFGAGGGARMAAEYAVQLLGSLPLDAHIRAEADGGAPTVISAPGTPRAAAYIEMARHTAGALARRGRDRRGQFPEIVVEES